MRRTLIVLMALMCMGCFTVYDIAPNAITQNNYGGATEVQTDPDTGELALAATAPSDGTATAQTGTGQNQNTVTIGGRNTAATDIVAEIEATMRDLFKPVE